MLSDNEFIKVLIKNTKCKISFPALAQWTNIAIPLRLMNLIIFVALLYEYESLNHRFWWLTSEQDFLKISNTAKFLNSLFFFLYAKPRKCKPIHYLTSYWWPTSTCTFKLIVLILNKQPPKTRISNSPFISWLSENRQLSCTVSIWNETKYHWHTGPI